MGKSLQYRGLILYVLITLISTPLLSSLEAQTQRIPERIDDREFWSLITELSETGGNFPLQYMSNEDSALFVIPFLREKTEKGGVYVGVGSEQNFTYVATVEPRIAFVVDIRRDNLLEHLMYKALFEMADNRADFVSLLFSRKRPEGLSSDSVVEDIFDAYRRVEPDSAFYEANLRSVLERLTLTHGFPLTDADKQSVTRSLNAFRTSGPYSLKGFGDTTNPTYAELMAKTDLDGQKQSYLASEDRFAVVRDLERRNLLVPLVGDFAGDKALMGIGSYVQDHNAIVNTFYVSNVERYLFEQGDHGQQFYSNAARLPADSSSLFVRSVTSDISRRLGIPIPESTAKWRTFLYSMEESLNGVRNGQIQNYAQLFEVGRR